MQCINQRFDNEIYLRRESYKPNVVCSTIFQFTKIKVGFRNFLTCLCTNISKISKITKKISKDHAKVLSNCGI